MWISRTDFRSKTNHLSEPDSDPHYLILIRYERTITRTCGRRSTSRWKSAEPCRQRSTGPRRRTLSSKQQHKACALYITKNGTRSVITINHLLLTGVRTINNSGYLKQIRAKPPILSDYCIFTLMLPDVKKIIEGGLGYKSERYHTVT